MATLTLVDITKRFGRSVIAVNNFNLEVEDGEFLVLLGPSGCGKTTTMRMIAGLEEVTEGTIYIGDRDVTGLAPKDRNVSMVFQNYAVWPHMSVFDNIAYALKLKKMSKQDIEKSVKEAARLTKIDELLERYPAQLSGGQQQRVAVARAIAVKPQIFLLDEPLSNLDAKLRVSTRTELKSIHAQTGATSVFVTHDQSEAMSMADRIVVMKDGEIIQVGSPDDVYHESNCLFVADFIGTPPTNFFDADVKSVNGAYHLIHPHFDITLDEKNSAAIKNYGKKAVIVGIRPENITLVEEQKAILSAEVHVSEPQGSHQIVALQLDDHIYKIISPSLPRIEAGDIVHLAFPQSALRFYDPDSGLRV